MTVSETIGSKVGKTIGSIINPLTWAKGISIGANKVVEVSDGVKTYIELKREESRKNKESDELKKAKELLKEHNIDFNSSN